MTPWHLRSITQVCQRCGEAATKELFNTYNAASGYFCGRCGDQVVNEKERTERQKGEG